MGGWIIFGILFLFILGLLWIPLVIDIDSEKEKYIFTWKPFGSVRILFDQLLPRGHISIFFWQKEFQLFTSEKKYQGVEKKVQKPGIRGSGTRKLKKIIRILRSFKISQMEFELDSGDYILNAYLFPLFHFMNRNGHRFRVNFNGQTRIRLLILNRPIWLLRAIVFK